MILTIDQYIEALTNTDGRFRTLAGIYPTGDSDTPHFTMPGRGLVDFEVMVGHVPCQMRCPLKWDDDTAGKLHLLSKKSNSSDTPPALQWRVMEDELTLFDEAGNSVQVNVLLRPVPPVPGPSPSRDIPKALGSPEDFEEFSWDPVWGLATAMVDGQWRLLDSTGAILTNEPYDWMTDCSEGFVLAVKNGKHGFLDTSGREVVPFIYDDATSFSGGEAFVVKDGKSFFISK